MRHSIWLALAALTCQANARLPWTLDIRGAAPSRPTQIQSPALQDLDVDDVLAGLPAPTTTPPPSQAVVDLRLRQDASSASSSSNTWENSQTCGWYSGLSSRPYVCVSPLSCATNTDHVVACSTAGINEFYTICLNYEAVQSSKCTSAGPKTACCTDSGSPACGTFQWSGTPTRSMYRCFATPTIIPMIDEPQFVVDASISSASVASSSSAAAAASRSSASAASASAAASRASGIGGSSVTITTTATDGSSTTFTAVAGATGSASGVTFVTSVLYTTTGSDGASTTYTAIGQDGVVGASGSSGSNGSSGGSGGTNTAAIAGGVIGGILGLLLMLLLMWYLMKKKSGNKLSLKLCGGKKKVKKGDKTTKYSFTEKNTHKDNREYNDKREYNNRHSSGSDDGKSKGFPLFGGGAKSKKEENTSTNNYYYGDEVRNDNRSYDKRKYKDNRAFEDNRKFQSDSESRSVTPSQTQGFHFETETQGSGQRPSFDSRGDTIIGVGAVGGRGSSRREQRQRGPASRAQSYQPDSRSPSPAPVSPLSDMAVGRGGTSRRDKRKQERKQARGEFTPSPEPQADRDVEYAADEEAQRVSSGTPADWQGLASHVNSYYTNEGSGSQQPQNVHVHVHIHDRDREGGRGRSRHSQDRSRASSNRVKHHDEYEDELGDEERQQEMEREHQGSRTHRYHPGSGRRNVPISRSPSPPPATLAPHPDDFIGRGL